MARPTGIQPAATANVRSSVEAWRTLAEWASSCATRNLRRTSPWPPTPVGPSRRSIGCSTALPRHVTHLIENTIYLATVDHLVEILRQTPDKVATLLAVGHNPGFAELASWLAGSGEADELALMRAKFPTAALAVLDFEIDHWSEVREGGARLTRFATPGILRGEETEDPD